MQNTVLDCIYFSQNIKFYLDIISWKTQTHTNLDCNKKLVIHQIWTGIANLTTLHLNWNHAKRCFVVVVVFTKCPCSILCLPVLLYFVHLQDSHLFFLSTKEVSQYQYINIKYPSSIFCLFFFFCYMKRMFHVVPGKWKGVTELCSQFTAAFTKCESYKDLISLKST